MKKFMLVMLLSFFSEALMAYDLFNFKFNNKKCNFPDGFFVKQVKDSSQFSKFLSPLKDDFGTVVSNPEYSDYDRLPTNEDLVHKKILESKISGFFGDKKSVDRNFLMSAAPDARKIVKSGIFEKIMDLKRVDGYMFHGSMIGPEKMKEIGGICNSNPSLDIVGYWVNEPGDPHPGWVSVSKSAHIAKKHGSTTWLEGHLPSKGWFYVMYVHEGFEIHDYENVLPYLKKSIYTWPKISNVWFEQEVSAYRSIPWSQFMAYRELDEWGFMTGDIYVREGLKDIDPEGYEKIVDTLSGRDFLR